MTSNNSHLNNNSKIINLKNVFILYFSIHWTDNIQVHSVRHSLTCVKLNTATTYCLLCNSISFCSVAHTLSLALNSDLAAAHNWDLLMKLKHPCSSQALDASHLIHSIATGALALQICLFWIHYDHCDKSGQRWKADWMHCDWMRQIMRKCCRRDASVYWKALLRETSQPCFHFISNVRKQHMALQDSLTYKQTSQQSVAGLCIFISTRYLIVESRFVFFFCLKLLCNFSMLKCYSENDRCQSNIKFQNITKSR